MKRTPLQVVVCWLVVGCAGVHRFHPNFYSLDGDIRLGEQLSKEVETDLVLLRHSALNQVVNTVGRRLLDASPEPAFKLFPYSYHVVDSPEVNAFALPGGPVYLNMGIVEVCETEDELASVMAHEMSHVAARHATEMLTNAAGYDPTAMASVFQKLSEQQHSLPSVVERFMSSHPLSEVRMRDAERQSAQLERPNAAAVAAASPSTFPQVKMMFAKD